MVPAFVVGAIASPLLSNRFTSQSFLLNGMAIGFGSNVDDLLVFFFINEVEREAIAGDGHAPCSDIAEVECGLPWSVVHLAVLVFAATNQRNKDWWSVLKDTILTWLTLLLAFIFPWMLSPILHFGVAAQLFSTTNPSCDSDFYLANVADPRPAIDSRVLLLHTATQQLLPIFTNYSALPFPPSGA